MRRLLPAWVHVVDREGFALDLSPDAVLHAVPCRSQAGEKDLARQLPARAAGDERLRIGLVHGMTFDLAGHETNFPTLVARKRAHEAARQARDDAAQALAKLEGQLEEKRAAAALLDRPGAAAVLQSSEAALVAVPRPERPASAADVEEARRRLEQAERDLEDTARMLHQSEGALEQVGGSVAAERLHDAEAALAQAREDQARLEGDYRAWQLLLTVLNEAANDQVDHLGKLLVEPVAARFRALTAERYDGLALDTDLTTQGVLAAGQTRDPGRLSVGTREQLATIFRLALAEQLRSVVLLDDQLVQSDRARMSWFATVLRELATRIQIVVLTCRPDDYLWPGELPKADGPAFLESSAALVRAVDLARPVCR
jgi:DNA repair exonuclease SbcCD ATPase subunit